METSYLKTLELNKIIERAAAGCVCKEAKAKMLELAPLCDPDEVRFALEQTDAINTLLIKNGSPRFGGVEGVSALATRAVKGGVLSMGELLLVAGALRNFQNLSSWYGSTDHDALPTDDLFYAGPSARAGTADLGRHSGPRYHGGHSFPHSGGAAQKNTLHRERHP